MKTKTLCLLLGIILFASCGKSAPKGDSKEVKSMVINLVVDKVNEELNGYEYDRPFNVIDLCSNICSITRNKVDAFVELNPNISDKGPYYTEIKKQVQDSVVNSIKANLKIENIRLVSKDDKIRKCECEGDLYNGDQKVQILSFSAQYTEENKLYVELHF